MSTPWIWIFGILFAVARGKEGILRMKTDFTTDTDQLQLQPTGTSLTFRVKARNDATIALFNSWTNPTEAYEVVIGGWANTKSVLRRIQQAAPKEAVDIKNILHQNEYKDFWVRWQDGQIELGSGENVGEDSILFWRDENPRPIAMVAIANGYGSDGTWEIPQQAAKQIRIKTPTTKSYDLARFSTTPAQKFSFSVKACKDVYLALFSEFANTQAQTYDVLIGGWGNKRSRIRLIDREQTVASNPTDGILKCNEYQPFWVSWSQNFIQVGKGAKTGSAIFLHHASSDIGKIIAVAISTGQGAGGRWQFLDSTVCPAGTWGLHCASNCSVGCSNVCNAETGTCQCNDGWFGPHCNNSCSSNCVNKRSCDKRQGHCVCNAGYQPPTCESVCQSGWFGQNCTQLCSSGCHGGQCGNTDGACACLESHYGDNCTGICSKGCSSLPCDKHTGKCTCKPGWQPPMCEIECVDGFWGSGCTENCSENCVDNNHCNKTDGACICKSGFMGPTCSQICDVGRWGQNCRNLCSDNCINGCINSNGSCSGGCKAGFRSQACNLTCGAGRWGEGCQYICSENCLNTHKCDKINGACAGGCKAGFRDQTCSLPCEDGKFGFNCDISCYCKHGHDDCDKANGTCASGLCVKGREGVACQELSAQASSSSLSIGIGVGITAITLVVLAAILTIFFLRRRQKRTESAKSENHLTLDPMPTISSAQSITEEASLTVSTAQPTANDNARQSIPDEINYENLGIRVAEFPDYVRGMKQTENGFQEEYESLPTGLSASCEVGSTAEASIKNRFKNIIAYDHSRVYIKGDTPLSQYINANFISGFGAPKSFIASQGPVKETVADFIQMMWEQKVPLVVMVTCLKEKGKAKCHQYWPEEISTGSMTHREIVVKKLREEKFPHFIMRHLESEKDNVKQPWTHLQYISWPDHGVPESPAAFLEFHQKAKQMYRPDIGPTVVHCSAGVGRTGTFLAVDYLLKQAESEGFISISDCVKLMRKDRVNMVQSLDQYVFIHESVLEALHCGKTVYDAASYDGFRSSVNKQELFKQYEMLEKMRPVVPNANLASAKYKENSEKNRSPDVLANSKWRPLLRTTDTETSDYINAVFVHGYQKKHAFIATQSPLPGTIIDILRLLQNYECNTIIALNDTGSDEACPNYSTKEEEEIGPFILDVVEETESNDYTRRHLKLKYRGEERKVMQFQVKSWAPGALPPAETLLSLYGEVKAWQQESGDSRIIVHCLYGAAETGLYLCICHVCDKIEREQEVDVFHAVQMIRKSQPLFINNKEQYEWLHQAAYEYICSFSMYANFK